MDAQHYEYPKNHWVVQFKMVDFMACELCIIVVMHGCESWIIKKAERWRIDAFELWCWRRLLRARWIGRKSVLYIIGRTDVEVETPVLWPPDAKNWLTGKRPRWRERLKASGEGETEREMVGLHHQLDAHEFEQALGVSDGQGSLSCCNPQGRKELDTTEQLNWNE